MSEVTVESLPEEVLVEVFKWLDTKSLKNVMLTCKEWADYVRRSHQWTLSLTATRSLEGIEALQNRKYNKVLIDGWTDPNDKFLEFFEMYGASVHELTISYARLTNASFWCKILNTMPNLKKVVFTMNWGVHFSDVSDDELPRLHKLKTLELDVKSTAVLKLFKKCQLHTLTVKFLGNYSGPDERMWTFLATQQDLKVFKLDSGSCSTLFVTPVTQKSISFRLKKLSVSGRAFMASDMPTNSVNNLMEFMKLHKNTLEDLKLRLKFPETVHEFVLSELKHLKTLSLNMDDTPQTLLGVNRSVANLQLEIIGRTTNPLRGAKPFISRLPNVQKLVIIGPFDSLFAKYIAGNMKQLKSFDVNTVESITFDGARFPALESLRIRQLNGPINWFAFAKNNPSIKELWIENVGKPIYLDVYGIIRNLKLSKLIIENSELKCDEKFFEVIRKNCPELKSLELNEKSLKVDISTVADIPGLIFRKF